jgi:hypothetical protein
MRSLIKTMIWCLYEEVRKLANAVTILQLGSISFGSDVSC